MSTTHPTNISTEWDDIQRKYGNLPKLEIEKTNEELDSAFIEKTEEELLRESRLKQWKKKLTNNRIIKYGNPIYITANNFVEQVTNSSKYNQYNEDKEYKDLSDKTGYYVPVLLLDNTKESNYLKQAWNLLSKKYQQIKFTIGCVNNVLKIDNNKINPPSSILLYFNGTCILQKNVSTLFKINNFELSEDSIENRLANGLENILNSLEGHLPLIQEKRICEDSDCDESETDIDSDNDYLKSSGKDLKTDFLNKLTRGKMGNMETSKTYTSWILDKALND